MRTLDWVVLLGTLLFIVGYGVWKTRGSKNIESFLLGDKNMNWWTVGLGIMATQASAVTFLSAPGQAYDDGMRFIQIYFGLPFAMVFISIALVPFYHNLKVYTAYEFLEKRFNVVLRVFTAILFLTQRGLAAGFTIFAPSLILSTLLGWNIYLMNLIIGLLVIAYTVSGGTKAVAQTQKQQMYVIMVGMVIAGVLVVRMMPQDVGFVDALNIAGKTGRLNVIDLNFDPFSQFNIWSGLIGGLFLSMSYFGTDQSQVQRYLSGSSIAQSRLGLLFNGIVKIPMQFMILLIGALMYVFYIFTVPPLFFNSVVEKQTIESSVGDKYIALQEDFKSQHELKQEKAYNLLDAIESNDQQQISLASKELQVVDALTKSTKNKAKEIIKAANEEADTNDTNFIFLTYVINFLPAGLVGLLIAVILSASMSSTAAELNALASTSIVDVYKRLIKKDGSDQHYLAASRWITVAWGSYAILFAMYANRLGSLIVAINVMGSLVYGTILGIFLVAFYFKKLRWRNTLIAATLSEIIILSLWFFTEVPFLWYNVIGALGVILFSALLEAVHPEKAY